MSNHYVLAPTFKYVLQQDAATHILQHNLYSGQTITATLIKGTVFYTLTTRTGVTRPISGEHFEAYAERASDKLLKSIYLLPNDVQLHCFYVNPGVKPYFAYAVGNILPSALQPYILSQTDSSTVGYTDTDLADPQFAINTLKEILNGKKTNSTSQV